MSRDSAIKERERSIAQDARDSVKRSYRSPYEIGRQHGLSGATPLLHRSLKPYDDESVQYAYDLGIKDGHEARMENMRGRLK